MRAAIPRGTSMGRSPKLRSRRMRRPCAMAPRLNGALLLLLRLPLLLLLEGLGQPAPRKIPESSTVPDEVFNDSDEVNAGKERRKTNICYTLQSFASPTRIT